MSIADPFFTILTASLNSAASIEECLTTTRGQSFRDFEHVVIDGVSKDGTCELLESFSGTYPLRWQSEPDEGIADALNKGLHLARGKYILVLQADDRLLAPDSLEKVHELIQHEPSEFHIFPVIFEHPDKGKVLLKPKPFLWWNHVKFIFCHQGCFTRRDVFERIGEFRTFLSLTFDYDFFYRALMDNCTIRFERFPVTIMGGGGISSRSDYLFKRLTEEYLVQRMNETNPFWHMAQFLFRKCYIPYKRLTSVTLRERKCSTQDIT